MRKIWDIHGGVHPAENKHQSVGTSIESAGIPPQLVYPLSQHIGAPAKPIVSVGQQVLKGEMIAAANGFVSVPLHASTSGTIIAIEDRALPHPSGMSGTCIVLQSDGKNEWLKLSGLDDYTQADKSELIDIVRNAGIAGMGGAGFPSAVKLNTRPDQTIETLIINGTECEPYITADDILMRERADQIIAGVKILQHIIQPGRETLIGVEDNKPEAIAALQQAAAGSDIEIVVFPTKYPSGGEKQLIQILTGKEVPSGGLPAQIGIVCQNIGTAVAIYRAVNFGEPLISRITTVTGAACTRQQNFEVLLGTPVSHLLSLVDFKPEKQQRLVMGGPMMGFALASSDVPVVKTTNCILAPTAKELPPPSPAQACIRCGMCAEACPVSLLPQQMYWYAQSKEYERLEEYNLFDCIECGACSFACPSNIPLVQYYRSSKAAIKQLQADHEKSERSQKRFEARQVRLEHEAAEKEAKRLARQQRAKAGAAGKASNADADDKADAIQAAIERAKAKKAGSAAATTTTTTTESTPANATAAAEIDPVQAAIDRAKAKRSGANIEESPQEKLARLQKAVVTAEKKLASSQEKVAQAREQGSDKLAAFETAAAKMAEKLEQAKTELAQAQAQSQSQSQAQTEETTDTEPLDPVQAAIERAKAKRARQAVSESDPKAKLEQDIASLQKRAANTENKLQQARQEGADTIDVLASSLEKIHGKLNDARQQLAELMAQDSPDGDSLNDQESGQQAIDPVQAAIDRAKAKRAAGTVTLNPQEKLQSDIESMEKRIANATQKLEMAEQQGSDKVAALRQSLEVLQDKLAKAQQELAELES